MGCCVAYVRRIRADKTHARYAGIGLSADYRRRPAEMVRDQFIRTGQPRRRGGQRRMGNHVNTPHEYDTHWEGFGDRYGIRLTAGQPFGVRVKHIFKMKFMATNRKREDRPAYERYIATAGSNSLSNTWRERSESNTTHALARTGYGFLAAWQRMHSASSGLIHRKGR